MSVFGAEGWPANQTFEHDGTYGPPVAAKRVPLASEDFRSDVIGRSDSRVGEDAARFTPRIDLTSIADGEIYLVQGDRIAIFLFLIGGSLEKLLVVRVFVYFMEAGRKTKICELNVAAFIE